MKDASRHPARELASGSFVPAGLCPDLLRRQHCVMKEGPRFSTGAEDHSRFWRLAGVPELASLLAFKIAACGVGSECRCVRDRKRPPVLGRGPSALLVT